MSADFIFLAQHDRLSAAGKESCRSNLWKVALPKYGSLYVQFLGSKEKRRNPPNC